LQKQKGRVEKMLNETLTNFCLDISEEGKFKEVATATTHYSLQSFSNGKDLQ